METAQREFHEETGIAQINIDPNAMFTEEYSFRQFGGNVLNAVNKKVTYFLGWVNETGDNQWSAHDEGVTQGKWVSFEEAKKMITFEEARAILNDVKAYLDKDRDKYNLTHNL